jgi:thiosulfate dehydrogenase
VRARARIIAALACAAPAALGCTSEPETRVVHGTAVDHGAALFSDPTIARTGFNAYSCATCHEAEAGDAGDAILPGAPLAGALQRPSYWGGQELDLLRSINACLYFFMLKDAPWTPDDVEARAMYAYLESLPGGGASAEPVAFTPVYALSDPPPGDGGRGGDIYRRACASCHGAAHSGAGRLVDRAPVLPEQTLEEHPLGDYTDAERRLVFVEKIRHGGFVGYGGQMPPFSSERLSDEDLGDLLMFFGVP